MSDFKREYTDKDEMIGKIAMNRKRTIAVIKKVTRDEEGRKIYIGVTLDSKKRWWETYDPIVLANSIREYYRQ